ncbi:MAG: adenylate kinase [Anaerolineae bacterium]|jgi:adenylate kinase|nr:adenylate kinase [Anaerolineae bacterium]
MKPAFIMFFGPPGCGKGTQAKKIVETVDLAQISTGELFRKHLGEKTPLGLEAQKYMSRGALVPDEITIGMVRERIMQPDCKNGAIFDGFPRTGAQAAALDKLLAELGTSLGMVVDFKLPIEVSRQRLMARQEGRADDKPEVIEKRLADHAEVEQSVMPHYHAQAGLVRDVDANRTIDEIFDDVLALIKSCMDQ